ncbi:MAG: patatin-like phospholipase family protein [Actinobacteria bacterium]|nr:patatin-like phospholipase family protein [Actinomycetota bacterium]
MNTAFVLSGGAALGAVQVGMMQSLHERDIRPDFIVGTSAGAINGSWIAGEGGYDNLDGLADVWRGLTRKRVFPTSWTQLIKGFSGRSNYLVNPAALRRVLSSNVHYQRLEDAAIPFHVVAADVLEGRDHLFSTGPTIDIVLASASIPGILPPVSVGGRTYVDGGTVNNTPLSHAIGLGADRVWVIPNGFTCGSEQMPTGALPMALHAVSLLVNRRLARDVERYRDHVDLRVVPPPCPIDVGALDFGQAAQLTDQAKLTAAAWLDTLDLEAPVGAPDEDVAGPASVEPGVIALDPDQVAE